MKLKLFQYQYIKIFLIIDSKSANKMFQCHKYANFNGIVLGTDKAAFKTAITHTLDNMYNIIHVTVDKAHVDLNMNKINLRKAFPVNILLRLCKHHVFETNGINEFRMCLHERRYHSYKHKFHKMVL